MMHDFPGCCGARIFYSLNKPNESDFNTMVSSTTATKKGVVLFIDNEATKLLSYLDTKLNRYVQDNEVKNGGKEWKKFIEDKGYRVDEIWLGGNPNHNEQTPHILTLYIWYLNKQKDTESVTVGPQQSRVKPPEVPPKPAPKVADVAPTPTPRPRRTRVADEMLREQARAISENNAFWRTLYGG